MVVAQATMSTGGATRPTRTLTPTRPPVQHDHHVEPMLQYIRTSVGLRKSTSVGGAVRPIKDKDVPMRRVMQVLHHRLAV